MLEQLRRSRRSGGAGVGHGGIAKERGAEVQYASSLKDATQKGSAALQAKAGALTSRFQLYIGSSLFLIGPMRSSRSCACQSDAWLVASGLARCSRRSSSPLAFQGRAARAFPRDHSVQRDALVRASFIPYGRALLRKGCTKAASYATS
ncbi:hypothetical protein GQ600_22320 [Phytophthora cactorum]|nr:hypothetical protein GQ600_22320 [Phytophthora cactorum]